MGKINFFWLSLALLNSKILKVYKPPKVTHTLSVSGIFRRKDYGALLDLCVLNGILYQDTCKCTLLDIRILDGNNCRTCSLQNTPCSKNQDCCPMSNGKAYCNTNSGRCEAIRYCDGSSSTTCPFDDLSVAEIADTVKIIQKSRLFSSQILYPIVRKQEPKKIDWNSGLSSAKSRIAYAAVLDVSRNTLYEVLINLKSRSIISSKISPQSAPAITSNEYSSAKEILVNDPRMISSYERRGLNMSYAAIDIFAFGAAGYVNGRRLVRAVVNYQDPATKYMDWRPLEGVEATVDIGEKKIINFIDLGIVPVPEAPILSVTVQDNLKPLRINQSEGSSITVNGFIINWYKWKFQYSIDPIHGLQLYHIRFFADCEERFLIYKLSISEMFVPYGAQGETWRWRGAFDAGEYGFGKSVGPLILGLDVPENAIMLSCPYLDDTTGEVSVIENCIALYERDGGTLYKHYDVGADEVYRKRSREMVVAFSCAIGNYDYVFQYIFKMSGNIDIDIRATGMVLSRATIQAKNDPNCIENCQDFIAEHTVGPEHQHFFCYRIDFDIEGTNNMLTEVDLVNDPIGPGNPDGGAFSVRRTLIPEETSREYSAKNARFWSVINPTSRNKFNTPRGYGIQVSNVIAPFLQAGDPLNQALYITQPFWVTTYNDDEQGAAGDFPRSGKFRQGLPQYIDDRQPLSNRDLVTWHTLGLTHATVPEEYPVMNTGSVGFHIVSKNFQSSNPAIPLKNQC